MPRKTDTITVQELRAIMRKFKIPGVYDVNAENKALYVDLVAKEIEKQGITCATDKKTVVTIIQRLDTQCGVTKMPVEQTAKMYVIDDVDIAEIVRKLLVTCQSGYCVDRDITIQHDGRVRVSDRRTSPELTEAEELREAGIKVTPSRDKR
jgi:hypothetical protein